MTRYVPRHMRDLADADFLDRLSPEERAWYENFEEEFYNGTPHGISSSEQIAEAVRVSGRTRRDLFYWGLRSDGSADRIAGTYVLDADLERPEVQRLLTEIRKLRPEFDEADGRRRARFASPLAETRFHQLRAQLSALLEGQDNEEADEANR